MGASISSGVEATLKTFFHPKAMERRDQGPIPAEDQFHQLRMGTVDFIQEEEFIFKLKEAQKHHRPLKVKFGADPSRSDLHLGHTVVANKLRQFQELGHQVDFIIGDFTALIGDPTGRNKTRAPLTTEQIQDNAKTYAAQIFKVLDPSKTNVIFNSTWLNALQPSEIVKLTAKFSVARMLEREDFSKRFSEEVPIFIHELLYPLFQGFDSVFLKSDVELGGTDQKFNMLVGRELQKDYLKVDRPQTVITVPILEGLDGVQKMSKSLDNYISVIDPPQQMFGKTMSVSDQLMVRWIELLSGITPSELSRLRQGLDTGEFHPRTVKVEFARFLVSRFHDQSLADQAVAEFEKIFVQKGLPSEMPEVIKACGEYSVLDLLVDLGMVASKGEGRRMIQQGGVYVDQVRVQDEKSLISSEQGLERVLQVGKKKFMKVKFM
jgi:tyrosyl-tRNA synthetase